jgi:hypothetical protein
MTPAQVFDLQIKVRDRKRSAAAGRPATVTNGAVRMQRHSTDKYLNEIIPPPAASKLLDCYSLNELSQFNCDKKPIVNL